MYGGASEDSVYRLLNKGSRIPPMRGLLSFYALVNSRKELEHLDGWLVNNLGVHSISEELFCNKSTVWIILAFQTSI